MSDADVAGNLPHGVLAASAWQRLRRPAWRKPRGSPCSSRSPPGCERGRRSRKRRAAFRLRVLKDDVIADIAIQAPTTIEKLRHLRSLPKGFERSRWGEAIVAAVERGLALDPKTLPLHARPQPVANASAVVESSSKVLLLRMISSATTSLLAKVIATVDDLAHIAADDEADVPALTGWRRDLFGEKALALKHGKLALAIEKGRVAPVETGLITPSTRPARGRSAAPARAIGSGCVRRRAPRLRPAGAARGGAAPPRASSWSAPRRASPQTWSTSDRRGRSAAPSTRARSSMRVEGQLAQPRWRQLVIHDQAATWRKKTASAR